MSFIFTVAPGSTMISGVRANPDGTRSAIPGSPFSIPQPAEQLLAASSNLIVRGESSVSLFSVDRTSGAIRQTDELPVPSIRDAAVTTADAILFVIDDSVVSAYNMIGGRFVASPGSPFPLSSMPEDATLDPKSLAPAPDGTTLYVALSERRQPDHQVFGKISHNQDGSLTGTALIDAVPQEVINTFAQKQESSGVRARLAAVITP